MTSDREPTKDLIVDEERLKEFEGATGLYVRARRDVDGERGFSSYDIASLQLESLMVWLFNPDKDELAVRTVAMLLHHPYDKLDAAIAAARPKPEPYDG